MTGGAAGAVFTDAACVDFTGVALTVADGVRADGGALGTGARVLATVIVVLVRGGSSGRGRSATRCVVIDTTHIVASPPASVAKIAVPTIAVRDHRKSRQPEIVVADRDPEILFTES